jgi:hypothetical protein
VEQWDQWERLAPNEERELAFQDEVRAAKAAAQVFAGSRAGGAGGARV